MSDIIITPKDWNIDAVKYGFKPGDRLILQGPTRAEIEFHNFKSTKDLPVIVTATAPILIKGVNPGGRVVNFMNCQNVRMTGDPAGVGDMNITITNGGQGVDFRDLSSGVEADHLTIDVGYSGLNAKTDPTCDPKTWRVSPSNPGGFVLDGVYFHHNDITTKTGEGIYIGESHYHTTFPLSGCPSGVTSAQEHEVKNVVVEDNLIRTSGADGIQVGSCLTGAIIRRNNVRKSGTAKVYGQTAGIIANPGTVAHIYDNVIEDVVGFAIQLQGPGGSEVHNNLILNSGSADGGGVMQVNYMPNGQVDKIYNNTFLGIVREGLEYYNAVEFRDNILNMASGGFYKQGGSAGKLTKSGNIELSGDPGQLKLDANYAPLPGSPAYGVDSDAGAIQSIKVKHEPGTIDVQTTAGVDEVFVTTPSGKRIKLK
jgi:hypothetical protein